MRIPRLTHPIEQRYRTRWLTEVFYVVSFIILILLALLNLALVGYDTVTIIAADPNVTYHDTWWAPQSLPDALRFRTKPDECQPTQLPRNTPLKTNSSLSLFSYVLTTDFSLPSANAESGFRSQIEYKANPLNRCRVQEMSITVQPKIEAFQISSSVQCYSTEDILANQTRVFGVTFSGCSDTRFGATNTIVDYLKFGGYMTDWDIYRRGPPRDPFLNILGVLDALANDLLFSMWVEVKHPEKSTIVADATTLRWSDSNDDGLLEYGQPPYVELFEFTNGMWTTIDYHRANETTKINLLIAVRDAIHLDLGYASPRNIYINKKAFTDTIIPSDSLGKALTRLPQPFRLCTWAWGCIDSGVVWAKALASSNESVNNITLPIPLATPIHPSVISLNYLCPQYRRKSWGSLIVSVFVGTFTMYATLYGIFNWLAPKLDERLSRPKPEGPFKHPDEDPNASDILLGEPSSRNSPFVVTLHIPRGAEELPLHDFTDRKHSAE